ncbi:hypothetical protein BD413DRAFT_20867 [Trametes elegans]|nr:hypothetical protein BD413DRAFT_20867 [Trametes elegans]
MKRAFPNQDPGPRPTTRRVGRGSYPLACAMHSRSASLPGEWVGSSPKASMFPSSVGRWSGVHISGNRSGPYSRPISSSTSSTPSSAPCLGLMLRDSGDDLHTLPSRADSLRREYRHPLGVRDLRHHRPWHVVRRRVRCRCGPAEPVAYPLATDARVSVAVDFAPRVLGEAVAPVPPGPVPGVRRLPRAVARGRRRHALRHVPRVGHVPRSWVLPRRDADGHTSLGVLPRAGVRYPCGEDVQGRDRRADWRAGRGIVGCVRRPDHRAVVH